MLINYRLYQQFEDSSKKNPSKIAFADQDIEITWKQAFELVLTICAEINNKFPMNIESPQNSRIVVKGDGSVFHVLIVFATIMSRRIYVPFNRTLERSAKLDLETIPEVTVLRNEIFSEDVRWLISLDPKAKSTKLSRFESSEAPAAFYYTSGTTGDPKIIVNSDSNIFRGANFVINALGLTCDDVIAGTLLLDFDYGINQIFCSLILGATYISSPYASQTSSWTKLVKKYRATIVPTMPFLVENYFPKNPTEVIDSVRICTSSGAPLTSSHAERITTLFERAEVVPMYGLSEGFRATILPPGEYATRPNSVGKPIGDTEIRIVKKDSEICKRFEVGEILQSSGCMTWGYYLDPLNTESKFVRDQDFPNRTWIRSGDLGYLDEEGYLFICGRVEHQIKLFGIRISIDEIEAKYKSIPGVVNAVVIPISVNETESNFAVGVVSELQISEVRAAIKGFPREYQTRELKIIPEVIANYNGGKPDRTANHIKYFHDK